MSLPTQRFPRLFFFLLLTELFINTTSLALINNPISRVQQQQQQQQHEIRQAILPDDLADIQECRRDAYKNQKNLLNSARSFCNADQIQKDGYVCIIAKETTEPYRVLGTADLNIRTRLVNNVYVIEEARKQGLGRKLMEAVEDVLEKPATLKLSVYSNNVPAVSLYRSLGFTTPGIHGVMSTLSSATSVNLLIEMEKEL
uniref:N-acetyltransferase domain-containing protein n=1 Tax=Helicotheca tamesis TaxID=374047 RepID=A0A7S2HRQ5_9STRA|mmetsp:Transcript_20369/g.27903  ORF Transcript_20369/g.27903 Transcript_20369/m.27903 type:complete len:200 (+) Transcript_20369:43-642(+)